MDGRPNLLCGRQISVFFFLFAAAVKEMIPLITVAVAIWAD